MGSLATQGALNKPGVTAFTGAGALTTLGNNSSDSMTAFAGTGVLASTATLIKPGTASFAATGSVVTSATLSSQGTTAFTGAGAFTTAATVSSGFTENGVDFDGSSYLAVSSPSWTSTTELTFFFSGKPDSITSILTLFHGGSGNRRVRIDNGDIDIRWSDDADVTAFSYGNTGVVQAANDRVNVLVAMDAGNDVARCWVWDETDGAWADAGSDLSNGGNGTLRNDPGALNVGHSGTASIYGGIAYRFAVWDSFLDITTATVKDNFVNSGDGSLVDPATSRTAYGTPLIDISGDAADYNNNPPIHDGSLTFNNATGTFTDE